MLLLVLVAFLLLLLQLVLLSLLLPAPLLLQLPLMPLLLRDVLYELSPCLSPWKTATGLKRLRSYLMPHERHVLPGSYCLFRRQISSSVYSSHPHFPRRW
ncbi:unnamed protein product [Ectocarpus sp. CCAP 1310/34]|nr:unnamed protein product [Ectocarpus sp. CCAP 1310/34]